MYVACKMDRAFTVNGVPAGRIGRAVELGLESHADNGLSRLQSDHFLGSLPGGPAGGSTQDFDSGDDAVFHLYGKFGGSELFTIVTEANLPR